MNIEEVYSILDGGRSTREKRESAVAYLLDCAGTLTGDPEQRSKTAYNIAGLMSTSFGRSLKDDDCIEEIFALAGELEVSSSIGTNDEQWEHLITLIGQLRE